MERITDIHMHVIPGVDDGARSMEESLEMLRCSAEQGVDCVFATPHSFAFDYSPEEIRERFARLQDRAGELARPMRLFLGCEIRIRPETVDACIEALEKGRYPALGGSHCALIEFDAYDCTQEDAELCARRVAAAGFTPVVAHAERYRFTSKEGAESLRIVGARIQINAYSIANERSGWIRENARALLSARLVDFIGTDAHRMDHRPPKIAEGVETLRLRFSEKYAAQICVGNPRQLLLRDAD